MNFNYCGLLRATVSENCRYKYYTLKTNTRGLPPVGEGWGKTLNMVLRVPPCFPNFSPQGEGSQEQIYEILLVRMKVFNAYKASPTGGKWGKVGEEV